jgi:uncharacterized membrane protein
MYLVLKYAHVLIAIVALGSSAALGFVHSFFADDPAHRDFALRLVRHLLWVIVIPGYVLMLVTGMWMGHVANLLDARWAEMAMKLWGVGALFIGLTVRSLNRQINGQGAALSGRLFGAAWGFVIVVILYFMVFKPA